VPRVPVWAKGKLLFTPSPTPGLKDLAGQYLGSFFDIIVKHLKME